MQTALIVDTNSLISHFPEKLTKKATETPFVYYTAFNSRGWPNACSKYTFEQPGVFAADTQDFTRIDFAVNKADSRPN